MVERSTDGAHFIARTSLSPTIKKGGTASYEYLDNTAPEGAVFYRIRSVETNGQVVYSPVVKVMNTNQGAVTLFPNPATGGKLAWSGVLPKGSYQIRIVNSSGVTILLSQWQYAGGKASENIILPAGVKPGVYTLLFTGNEQQVRQLFTVL